ncbi:MAG TPA: hypothetical protein VMT75_08925 [Candidatus Saccharimonadales bacterium]|nr:hypothetical protein [Candidatus Saccharimonadales bacterium]
MVFSLVLCLAMALVLPLRAQNALDPHSAVVQPSDLFSQVIAQQKKSEADLDQFSRVQRVESRKPGSGTSAIETRVFWLFPNGTGVSKLPLSLEGKPPDSAVYRSELEKLEKYLSWVVEDGQPQREALAKAERKRKERFDLIEATHQAFVFTLQGKETRAGRTLLRYRMEPRKDYKPTSRTTTLFTKVRGTIWVDEQSSQLAKVEGEVTEDISLALFLARVNKGSHFMQERYEIAPGVWEPTFEQYDFDGRKYFMTFSIHERTFYTDYKRVGPPRDSVQLVRAELSKLPAGSKP